MSISINGVDCEPETQVCFKTYNKTDSQTFYGRIIGTINFDVAIDYEDVVAVHKNMKASVASKEIAAETFLLIKTKDGAKRPFAISWIDAETFENLDTQSDANLTIYRISKDKLYQVLTTIRDLGYDVVVNN